MLSDYIKIRLFESLKHLVIRENHYSRVAYFILKRLPVPSVTNLTNRLLEPVTAFGSVDWEQNFPIMGADSSLPSCSSR